MARFITMLSGSLPSLVGTLAGHDVRTITNGENFRNGLITSRSTLSTDIYAELSPVNQNGGLGVFFPVDLISTTAVAGQITGSAYTSSRVGIITPSDYSIRPTASVLSTDGLSAPTSPLNLASASLVVYQSASKAVKDTLDAINLSTGNPDNFGSPYTRLGLNQSRTLHSIYHNPNLAFFAWDDFTPGTPTLTNTSVGNPTYTDLFTSNTNVVYLESGVDTFNITASWTAQYAADSLGKTTVNLTLEELSTGVQFAATASTVVGDLDARYSFAATRFARFSQSQETIGVSYQVQFSDETITSHTGPLVTKNFDTTGVRAQILYRRTNARATASFNAGDFCSVPATTTIFTVNQLASSSRLYTNKVGNRYLAPGALEGVPYYVGFGETGNISVFEYETGELQAFTANVDCGGVTTTTTTTTTVPPLECAGNQFGTCPPGPDIYCCSNGAEPPVYSCFSTPCGNQ